MFHARFGFKCPLAAVNRAGFRNYLHGQDAETISERRELSQNEILWLIADVTCDRLLSPCWTIKKWDSVT